MLRKLINYLRNGSSKPRERHFKHKYKGVVTIFLGDKPVHRFKLFVPENSRKKATGTMLASTINEVRIVVDNVHKHK